MTASTGNRDGPLEDRYLEIKEMTKALQVLAQTDLTRGIIQKAQGTVKNSQWIQIRWLVWHEGGGGGWGFWVVKFKKKIGTVL